MDTSNWKEYRVGDFIKYRTVKETLSSELTEEGKIPYLSSGLENNGIIGFYNIEPTQDGNCISTEALTIGKSFYHKNKFATRRDLNLWELKDDSKLTENVALFLITILDKNKSYTYGRKRNKERLANEYIKLPSIQNPDGSYSPDWEYMEDYIKSLKN